MVSVPSASRPDRHSALGAALFSVTLCQLCISPSALGPSLSVTFSVSALGAAQLSVAQLLPLGLTALDRFQLLVCCSALGRSALVVQLCVR